jgi:hypothetical protein
MQDELRTFSSFREADEADDQSKIQHPDDNSPAAA